MQAKSLTGEKCYGRLTAKIGACFNREMVAAVIRYSGFSATAEENRQAGGGRDWPVFYILSAKKYLCDYSLRWPKYTRL